MIPCPDKTVSDITISSLSTKYKRKFHLGNSFFFFFLCSRMGFISVSGRRRYLKELFGGMLQFYLEQFEMIIVLESNSHSRFLQKILQFI